MMASLASTLQLRPLRRMVQRLLLPLPDFVRASHNLAVGTVYSMNRTFDQAAVEAFITLTGDTNPIHIQNSTGGSSGSNGDTPLHGPQSAIVPGMLLASLFPAIIGSTFSGALYVTQSLSFRSHCPVGESVTAEVTITRASGSKVQFATVCRAEIGGRTLVNGVALALIKAQGVS